VYRRLTTRYRSLLTGVKGMRWKWLPVVVLVFATGCTEPDDDNVRRVAPHWPPPSSAPPAALVGLDVFGAAGVRAARVVPDLPGDQPLDVRGAQADVVAAGDALVSFTAGSGHDRRVARSLDLGVSWANVELPGASFPQLSVAGDLVVAIETVARRPHAWASADGFEWRGGPLPGDGIVSVWPGRLPDGQLVAAEQPEPGFGRLVVSADGGASWRLIDCPPQARRTAPHGPPQQCVAPVLAGRNLWVRLYEVSLDVGKTWQTVSVVPDPGSAIYPMISNTVVLPGGGWLGAVGVTLEAGGQFVEYLARSTDGLRWEPVIPHPCDKAEGAGSVVSKPQPLGDRWLVAYTCTVEKVFKPVRSQLYLVDRDATQARLLATVEQTGLSFGAPVAVRGTVVVPEIYGDHRGVGGTVTFLHLRQIP
jgi:hypothetical protein